MKSFYGADRCEIITSFFIRLIIMSFAVDALLALALVIISIQANRRIRKVERKENRTLLALTPRHQARFEALMQLPEKVSVFRTLLREINLGMLRESSSFS